MVSFLRISSVEKLFLVIPMMVLIGISPVNAAVGDKIHQIIPSLINAFTKTRF
jgi:hypothetical protein